MRRPLATASETDLLSQRQACRAILMTTSRLRVARLLPLFPLAGCVSPVAAACRACGHPSSDREAAAHAGVKTFRIAGGYPEPKWLFAFDMPFDLRSAPLQVGRFAGTGTIAARVAAALPAQLRMPWMPWMRPARFRK